jgi:hypothetical protein
MSRLNGDEAHDLAAVLVAVERSNDTAAAKDAEPTDDQRAEIDRIAAQLRESE